MARSGLPASEKPTSQQPEVLWVDEECAGFRCLCGCRETLVGHIEAPEECPSCGRKWQLRMSVRLVEVP